MLSHKLVIFDLDDTLSPRDTDELFPDAKAWLIENAQTYKPIIATNQGGIGLRHWMETDGFGEPNKYPTLEMFEARLTKLFPDPVWAPQVLLCAAYQSKKSGLWSPVPEWGRSLAMFNQTWRKPSPGMLIHAMLVAGWVAPFDTLMVGDSLDDRDAAIAAGCAFKWAWQFFDRVKPEGVE